MSDEEWLTYKERWLQAMKEKGHFPQLDDDGTLDIFAINYGNHNGPSCETCGWSCCMHCNAEMFIPKCTSPTLDLKAEPALLLEKLEVGK